MSQIWLSGRKKPAERQRHDRESLPHHLTRYDATPQEDVSVPLWLIGANRGRGYQWQPCFVNGFKLEWH